MKHRLNVFISAILLGIASWSLSSYALTSINNNYKLETISSEADSKIQSLVFEGKLPSLAVAIVSKSQIVWSKTYGQNPDTELVFMIASAQKLFTATAVLQLHDNGIIDLDADVNTYLPFSLRHPQYPDIPITTKMLLSHRSGLNCPSNQFAWDTENSFSPAYRSACAKEIEEMSLEEYLIASLTIDGSNYDANLWKYKPGSEFHYSVAAYPLLRFIIERVSGQTYPEYMKEHILEPLEMSNSGFSSADFLENHAIPYTRIGNKNIQLPIWNGKGYMMRSTAEDMAKFMIAHMNQGNFQNFQLLKPKTISLMQEKHSHGKDLFHLSSKCINSGYGLGIIHYENNVLGHGGSAPGFQTLLSFKPSNQEGYVILTNINGILGGKETFDSVWASVSSVEDVLKSELGFSSNRNLVLIGIVIVVIIISDISLIVRRKVRDNKKKHREQH